MKYIFVLIIAIAIAVTEAAVPKAQNLCDRIKCDTAEKALTCATNGKIYKAFENPCEMKIYNCNKGERFAAVDKDVCKIVFELGLGFFAWFEIKIWIKNNIQFIYMVWMYFY